MPMPPINFEDDDTEEELELTIVDEDEEKDFELELNILEPPEDRSDPKSSPGPPKDIICEESPPIFMPCIIFFIMSSISRLMPGPPEELVVEVEDEMLEEENEVELEKEPSSLLVEVAIS